MHSVIHNVIKNMSRNKGFTLIELLVVIAIIGILASIILVNLGNTRKQARDASAMASMSSIRSAAEVYYSEHGNYGVTVVSASCPTIVATTSVFDNADVVRLTKGVSSQTTTVTCASLGTGTGTFATTWTVVTNLNDTTQKYCVDSNGFAGKLPASGTVPVLVGGSCI